MNEQGARGRYRVRPNFYILESMYKVVVIIPVSDAENMRQAIGDVGGGKIGNYSHCSFSVRGTGRFKPLPGAKPAIGEVGKLEEVEEERIEFVCADEALKAVLEVIQKNHPYEEPAVDVLKLADMGQ